MSEQESPFDVTVVMPALNEEASIRLAIENPLRAFRDFGIRGEILVINDGSRDRTEAIVREIMADTPLVRLIVHDSPRGIGVSFWDGVDQALGKVVVFLPGDNENDPWEIFQYFGLLNHVDIVIPFVFNRQTRSPFRNALSYLYRLIVNTTFMTNFNYTNGTILFRRSVLQELDFRSSGFFFQTDILVRTVKRGYLFAEVPYRLGMRKDGLSKAITFPSLGNVIRGYLRLVRAFYFTDRLAPRSTFSGDSMTARRKEDSGERREPGLQ